MATSGERDDAIHLAFTVVYTECVALQVDGRPRQVTDFADAEAAPQHQQKHRAVFQPIDHAKEGDDLGLGHRPGKPCGHEDLVPGELNRRLYQGTLGMQEDKKALQPAAAGHNGPWR